MTFLLDVNVLIALIDPDHVSHDAAHRWFEEQGKASWATCPMTENGVIRIVGHPKYPGTPGSPAVVAEIIKGLRTLSGHEFWPDDVSLVGEPRIDSSKILTSGQVTDTYLLALATIHHAMLATFDKRIMMEAVKGGKASLHLIASL